MQRQTLVHRRTAATPILPRRKAIRPFNASPPALVTARLAGAHYSATRPPATIQALAAGLWPSPSERQILPPAWRQASGTRPAQETPLMERPQWFGIMTAPTTRLSDIFRCITTLRETATP